MTLYFIFLHHLTKNNDKFLSSKLDAILEWVVVVLEESRGIVRIRTEQRKILISLGHSGVEFERGLSRVCDLHLTICEQRDWWCATVTNESTKFTYKAHLLLRASSPLRGNSKSKKKNIIRCSWCSIWLWCRMNDDLVKCLHAAHVEHSEIRQNTDCRLSDSCWIDESFYFWWIGSLETKQT